MFPPEEAFVVVEAAKDAGVKKIVITHPEWWVVDMSIDDQIRLVKDYDVILERCYAQNMAAVLTRAISQTIWSLLRPLVMNTLW